MNVLTFIECCGDLNLRVISGTCKGLSLKAVPGNTTRPTTDKVKEAIFNIIGPFFDGGIGLDLFAGSGGLGIEALSRGLDKVIFVDREIKAIQTIKSNVEICHLENKVEIYRNDAQRALKAIIKRKLLFNYIFLDPPYKKQELHKLLYKIDHECLLNQNGIIVCEHSSDIELPEIVGQLTKMKQEKYGIISISIFSNIVNGKEENNG